MPQVKRLFKIAKELNVGTSMLVEHLQEKGHAIDNTPNAKISGELYELLLKEFASDKLMREKAEQIAEKRNEERNNLLKQQPETPAPKPKEEEREPEILSAAQLRESAAKDPQDSEAEEQATPPTPTPTPVVPEVKETPPVVETPPPPPPVEVSPPEVVVPEAKEEKPEPPAPPKEEKESPVEDDKPASLKVVGKIDLDNLPSAKPKAKAPSPKSPPKKTEEKRKETPPPPPPPEPVAKPEVKEKAAPAVKEEKVPEVVAEKKPKVVEEKKEEPVAKKEEETPVVEDKSSPVITAEGNAPQLSGLKVLGKIDLTPKKKEPAAKTGQSSSGDGEESKNRRRRKRKRKKVPAETGNAAKKPGDNKSRTGGKAKPSQKQVGESIRNTMAQINRSSSRDRQRLRRAKRDADAERRRRSQEMQDEDSKVLEITEFITANEFANLISVPVNEIIKSTFDLGMMISINQRLDADVLSLLAEEFGFEAKFVDVKETEFEEEEEADSPEDLVDRSPIITVMGHVDHGKTTLLDHLRAANVAEGEAGGITQHIGAYSVELAESKKHVTFLDTPGHEAFTAMRARGAQATDIVIIVIAADDAVMPQTREAINHAQAAEVPMIFAFNKMDKAGADAERIKGQLAEMNLLVEDWGGEYQSQEISAKMGTNVNDLLEKVIIQADLLELKANPERRANGTVIEARLDKGRGNVATLLVQNGTLKVGDPMVAGIHFGKVRALINQNGDRIKEAGPSTPVQVLGLTGQPGAGDRFHVFTEEAKAKDISQKRQELYREQAFRQNNRITLDEIARRRAIGSFNELKVIIKGDVDGSVEALSGSLMKLSTEEVQVNIIMRAVGGITDNDVNLASASDAVIIGFNTRPSAQARSLAEREGIDIRTYSIIYDAINDVKDALEGLLSPEIKEEIAGTAEVRDVFKVTRVGTVAGCMVTSGKIFRNDPVRVIRDGVVIYTSSIDSLKRYKDDAKEVATGFECGIMVENYNDIKVGDVLETFKKVEVKRKLS